MSNKDNAAKNTPATTKVADWTKAQLDKITSATANCKLNNDGVKALLKDPIFAGSKNIAQLRGKIVSMKLYEAATKSAKPASEGGEPSRKMDFVHAIETFRSLPKGSLDTAEKMSKAQLELLCKTFTDESDQQAANSQA